MNSSLDNAAGSLRCVAAEDSDGTTGEDFRDGDVEGDRGVNVELYDRTSSGAQGGDEDGQSVSPVMNSSLDNAAGSLRCVAAEDSDGTTDEDFRDGDVAGDRGVNVELYDRTSSGAQGGDEDGQSVAPVMNSSLDNAAGSLRCVAAEDSDGTTGEDFRDGDVEGDRGVNVELYDRTSCFGKRSWKKDHCCLYCHKYVSKMARHLIDCHLLENEVKKAYDLPIKSPDRRRLLEQLMHVGDYYHNVDVLEKGSGDLIVLRRPTQQECLARQIQYSDYTPCPGCLGFVTKRDLWRHVRRCKHISLSDYSERCSPQQASRLLLFPIANDISPQFRSDIINRMLDDEKAKITRTDWLILQLGSFMYKQYGSSQRALISQRMRLLARLLIALRNHTQRPTLTLMECVDPDMFDHIIEVVHQLCDVQTSGQARPHMQSRPSFALKVGHELRRSAELVRNVALKRHDQALLQKANEFLQVRSFEWPALVSGTALSTLSRQKQNKPDLLPCTTDVVTLVKYLKAKISSLLQQMTDNPSCSTLHQLCEVTLARIIVFNKRRSGEVSRMTVDDYEHRPTWHAASAQDFRAVLSTLEKKLVDRMELMKIVGKRGSSAPVLLTPDMTSALNCMLLHRSQFGIAANNKFLFANNMSQNGEPLRGHECIKKHTLAADIPHAERMTSTKLRKYMATVSQIFELTEGEVDWLARHLTHDIRVHREFYRLHDSSVELAKVSKLLLAVESGHPGEWKGKGLDEIDLNMIGLSDTEMGLSGDDDTDDDCADESLARRCDSICKCT